MCLHTKKSIKLPSNCVDFRCLKQSLRVQEQEISSMCLTPLSCNPASVPCPSSGHIPVQVPFLLLPLKVPRCLHVPISVIVFIKYSHCLLVSFQKNTNLNKLNTTKQLNVIQSIEKCTNLTTPRESSKANNQKLDSMNTLKTNQLEVAMCLICVQVQRLVKDRCLQPLIAQLPLTEENQ